MLVTNHANYEKKSPLLRKAFEPLLGDGLFISDGKTWQYRRNMEEPLFTAEQAAKYTNIMVKATEECVQNWVTLKPGATLNVLPEMVKLSTEIIYRTLFGNQPHTGQITQLIKSMAQYQTAIGKMDNNAFFGLPNWIPGVKRIYMRKSMQC